MGIFSNIFQQLELFRYRLSRHNLLVVLWGFVLLIGVGTLGFMLLEGWSPLEALYTTIVTVTTIGYGDYSPDSAAGQIFVIFFAIAAVGVAGYAISAVATYVLQTQLSRMQAVLRKRRMDRINKLDQHFIVCGAGNIGTRIIREFKAAGKPFVLIEQDEAQLKQALLLLHPDYYKATLEIILNVVNLDLSTYEEMTLGELADELDVAYILGDPTDDRLLRKAGIGRAAGLVTVLPDDRDNLSVIIGANALSKRHDNASLHIISSVQKIQQISKMYFSGATEVMAPDVIGGSRMAHHLMNPQVGEFYKEHMRDERFGQFHQASVTPDHPEWVGKSVAALQSESQIAILAIKRNGVFLGESPPSAEAIIEENDILILFGDNQS